MRVTPLEWNKAHRLIRGNDATRYKGTKKIANNTYLEERHHDIRRTRGFNGYRTTERRWWHSGGRQNIGYDKDHSYEVVWGDSGYATKETGLRTYDRSIALKLHHTDIATIFPDNTAILDSGGWNTYTTKDRLCYLDNVSVFSHRREWYYISPYYKDEMNTFILREGPFLEAIYSTWSEKWMLPRSFRFRFFTPLFYDHMVVDLNTGKILSGETYRDDRIERERYLTPDHPTLIEWVETGVRDVDIIREHGVERDQTQLIGA